MLNDFLCNERALLWAWWALVATVCCLLLVGLSFLVGWLL